MRKASLESRSHFNFDEATLVELGGSWALLREAEELFKAGAVKACEWLQPVLSGRVEWGEQSFFPKLNLRSQVMPECKCPCPKGRGGRVCVHALALCLYLKEAPDGALTPEVVPEKIAEPIPTCTKQSTRLEPLPEGHEMAGEGQVIVRHLRLSKKKGTPLSFQIFLPPNLAQTAPRDAMVVKIDACIDKNLIPLERLNRGRAYQLEPAYYRVAGLIESWCQGKYHGILQLNRERLRALLESVAGEPAVYWVNQDQPLIWVDGRLPGVHECLDIQEEIKAPFKTPQRSNTPPPNAILPKVEPMHVDGSMNFIAITLPSRESAVYSHALELLKNQGFQLDPSSRQWWLRDRHKTLNFLAKNWNLLKEQWGAIFSKNFLHHTACLHFIEVTSQAKEVDGQFSITLRLSAGKADEATLRQALAKGQHYVEQGKHAYLIDPEALERFAEAQRALSGEATRLCTPVYTRQVQAAELADVESLIEASGAPILPPEAWKARSAALKCIASLVQAPIAPELNAKLRTYQQIGVAWLWHLYKSALGGILADEMGLGKTVQALALLSAIRKESPDKGPTLVVSPAGLVENWRREAHTFTPELTTFVHHRDDRLMTIEDFGRYDIIITSYSTLTRDLELFQNVPFAAVIGDEAQHVKNRLTRNAKALRMLRSEARFLLTGTPLENSLDDLRSLFDFLMPGYLTRLPSSIRADERGWYDGRLRSQAAPYILRRSKALVAPELPQKIEQVVYCALEPAQLALYKEIQQKTEAEIAHLEYAGVPESQVRMAAMNQLLRLRQVCADPRILEPKAKAEDSTKLRAFREILAEAIDGDHRILVFSQFVSMLTLLKEELESTGVRYCYLDGQTKDRLAVCDEFNNTPEIPVFLISLKAGGTGLNLTGADTVIHYDPWWNPAVEAQATDRAHRIGQHRVVTSIKLITASTVEEKVMALQAVKSTLLKDLLEASSEANAKIGLSDIKALLDISPSGVNNA